MPEEGDHSFNNNYIGNVNVETLTTGRMVPWEITSSPAEISTHS